MSDYRSKIYRLMFGLAAVYNVAFGIWACFWPGALFAKLEMAPPNYPSLWQCLGMVVGLYGLLYAYAAVRLDRAKLIIAVGLAGKILGPIGHRLALVALAVALAGLACDLFAESLLIGWLPDRIDTVAPLASLLTVAQQMVSIVPPGHCSLCARPHCAARCAHWHGQSGQAALL